MWLLKLIDMYIDYHRVVLYGMIFSIYFDMSYSPYF